MNNIKVPKDWSIVARESYGQLKIFDNESAPCVCAYATSYGNQTSIIFYNNYSKADATFFETLNNYYEELNLMNELIDGKEDDLNYEDTSFVKNLFHGFINEDDGIYYLVVNKVATLNSHVYSFQLFNKGKNGMFCMQTNLFKLDEKNIVSSAQKIPFINKAIKILIQMANI